MDNYEPARSVVGILAIAGIIFGGIFTVDIIFGPKPLQLLQDRVMVGDCIASKLPDFGAPEKMYSDKFYRVLSKGRDGVLVDVLITSDYGKTYTRAGESTLYWTDINLTYTVFTCPKESSND
jgi:hypothetical protein